jgi:hypothetical protein
VRIEGSEIFMRSEHTYAEYTEKEEQLHYWNSNVNVQMDSKEVSLTISEQAQKLYAQTKSQFSQQNSPALGNNPIAPILAPAAEEEQFELSDKDKQLIHLLQTFIESLTGKKIKFFVPRMPDSSSNTIDPNPTQSVGWGLTYNRREAYSEYEHTTFEAQGIIKTTDGREIQLQLNMSMSRSFTSETTLSVRAGDALKDPLVINLGNQPVALTATKYAFDIDSDGQADQISFVGNQSGFLALDLNEDGIINHGAELFGASTGDGFGDLAKFDLDRNDWIDENDEIYNQLRIWMKDEDGNDRLLALGQLGVGAIYLGHAHTTFDLNNGHNELHGRVRHSGIYLRENGSVGTVQQIDLAI